MTLEGFVDWRGKPVDPKRHGGLRATFFLYFMVVVTNCANIANIMNLVGYLYGTLHMGIASASTTVTNFVGAMCVFSLLGAFISDSYIKRFTTIFIFGPFEILGYGLLALQAHLPSLRPAPCNIFIDPSSCERIHGRNATIFYLGLYLVTLGEGCVRACVPSLGADQFDDSDTEESRQKISFFNWITFAISLGVFIGLILIVWIENYRGWDIGFAVCALIVLVGLLVVACGFPFYRNQNPTGSPLTRILQVLIASFKNRKVINPENIEEPQEIACGSDAIGAELLSRTKGLQFLDKASIRNGKAGPWSHCSTTQVEETKIVLRMLPLFISSIFGYLPFSLLLTFTVQQGATMDTKLGSIHVPPASLFVIPSVFQMLTLAIYDRFIVPFLRRITGYKAGITHLQRIAIGFVFTAVATSVAALVERKRMTVAINHGLTEIPIGVPISSLWLIPQFFLLSLLDVTSFVGLLEFFHSEASMGMKSIGTSIFFCIVGLSAWVGSLLIQIVNRITRDSNGSSGWLDGANLNKSRLDLFYWLLSVFELVSFLNFVYWARRYKYRHNPRIVSSD